MPMVKYWKIKDKVDAKVMRSKEGALIMKMEGEDQPFPGFPRGFLLFGKLSKLKHEIKNQIFNESWALLEKGDSTDTVVSRIIYEILPKIFTLALETKYDQVPESKMIPAVREIYRAWTKVAPPMTYPLRDILCFILQEDDSYRFRVQFISNYFTNDALTSLDKALGILEHAEVIDDMKERQRLLKRILMAFVKDDRVKPLFLAFFKEVDWKKVHLTEADKYHFRGKYFKVDYDLFDY